MPGWHHLLGTHAQKILDVFLSLYESADELVPQVPEVSQTDNLNTLKELFQSSGLHDTAVLARPLIRTNQILKNVHPD